MTAANARAGLAAEGGLVAQLERLTELLFWDVRAGRHEAFRNAPNTVKPFMILNDNVGSSERRAHVGVLL